MTHAAWRRRWSWFGLGAALWLLVAPLLAVAAPPAGDVAPPVLERDAADKLLKALAPVQVDVPRPDGVVLDEVAIRRDRVRLAAHPTGVQKQPPVLVLQLVPKREAKPGEQTSASFAIRSESVPTSAGATALQTELIANLQRNDKGDLYVVPELHETHLDRPSRERDRLQVLWALLGLVGLTGVSWLVLAQRGRLAPKGERWARHVRITHLLPASLQCIIFLYWSLYWRELPEVASVIALQVVFALVLDGLFGFWREGKWTFSFGALPIALSSNLFVIFAPDGAWLSLLGISAGLASKHWIRGPHGHLFNPSAIGMFSVGMLTLFFPQIGYGDTAYEFALAPNTTELILILALVVQLRLPVVLVSIATFCGLMLAGHLYGRLSFDPAWPPIALVVTLLVTDPATQPRTPLGRIVFGLTAGVLMRVCGELLQTHLSQDFWGKVGGVALANLLVPWINLAVDRLPKVSHDLWGVLSKRWNLLHIAVWWGLMYANLFEPNGKAQLLTDAKGVQQAHVRNGTPFVTPVADGTAVRCADNPMLCDVFSFPLEIRCWLGPAGDPRCGPGSEGWQGPGRGAHNLGVARQQHIGLPDPRKHPTAPALPAPGSPAPLPSQAR